MTPEQEKHLARIKSAFTVHADTKYRKGVQEHGGNLWDKTPLELIEEAILENIDQFTYLMTCRDKLLGKI